MSGVKLEIAVAPPVNIVANQLLAGLPAAVQGRLLPQLDLVDMPLGKVLLEHGCTPRRLYFPTTLIASILNQTADGASEAVYANMPVFGLAAATSHVPVGRKGQSASRRIGATDTDEVGVPA